VFAYQATLAPEQYELFVLRWAAIPVEIAERADFPPVTPFPIEGTLLSALFLHASLLHLAINMALLALFGPRLERAIGSHATLALFLLGGLLGGVTQVYATPQSLVPLVGASGAIAALMAAALILAPGSTPRTLIFTAWLAAQIAAGVQELSAINQIGGGTAVWSHLGGLAAGVALAALARLTGFRRVARPRP
jgi:membrane associated rhomboid family serine protease